MRWTSNSSPLKKSSRACLGWIGVCLMLASVTHAGPVVLMDGLLVDRLEERSGPTPDTRPEPRRPIESLFEAPPDTLSLDLPSIEQPAAAEDEVVRRRRAAEMHFRDRRWESALREYQQLMRLRPGHLPYLKRAAMVASLAGRYGTADVLFRDVIQAEPNEVNYLAAWGNVLIRLKRMDEAQDVLDRALALNPDHLLARYNQLLLNMAQDDAVVDFDFWDYRPFPAVVNTAAWLTSDADDLARYLGPDRFNHMVRTALGGLSDDRLADFNRTVHSAWMNLEREEWRGAYDLLTRAQELGSELPFLQLERIRCLVELGEVDEAVLKVESLVSAHDPVPELLYGYAFILIKAGVYERAIPALRELLEARPESTESRFALACAYAGAARMDDAWPILEDLAQEHPNRFPVWMEGDAPYLEAIRADPRYGELGRRR